MVTRYGMLYSDGSMNLCPEGKDLSHARKQLNMSTDDGDTELVKVELKIVQMFGPKEKKVLCKYVVCPCCSENIEVQEETVLTTPTNPSEG